MNLSKEGLNIVQLPKRSKKISAQLAEQFAGSKQHPALIHPFYREDQQEYISRPGQHLYREERDDLLADAFRKGLTPLIFEQFTDFKKLPQRLRHFGPGTVYAWMTPISDPTPLTFDLMQKLAGGGIFKRRPILQVLPDDMEKQCWDNFSGWAQQAAVESFTAGGQCLIFLNEEDIPEQLKQPTIDRSRISGQPDPSLIPGFCVGIFATQLAVRGISTELTLPSWPNDFWKNRYTYFDKNEV